MTYAVGLTGGIGSGKSSVARHFEMRGISVIDADALSRELSAPGGRAIDLIRAAFGEEMIGADGGLDRARMRTKVFADPQAKRLLESILHPLIGQAAEQQARSASGPYVIHMVPLLVESGRVKQRVDRLLVVDCPEQTQIDRVMARSGLKREEVEAIMAQQATRAQRLAEADDVIDNSGAPEALEAQVEQLHRRYLALAGA